MSGCARTSDTSAAHRGSDLLSDVLQDEIPRDRVEHDLTARRQEREALLDLTLQRLSANAGHRSKTLIEPELTALVPDEIQRGQYGLASGKPQAAPELLQEDGRALGGAQE